MTDVITLRTYYWLPLDGTAERGEPLLGFAQAAWPGGDLLRTVVK